EERHAFGPPLELIVQRLGERVGVQARLDARSSDPLDWRLARRWPLGTGEAQSSAQGQERGPRGETSAVDAPVHGRSPSLWRWAGSTARCNDGGSGRSLDDLVFAQKGDHTHGRGIALADLGKLEDPRVSARAAAVARTDLVEELVGHILLGQDGQDPAKIVRV